MYLRAFRMRGEGLKPPPELVVGFSLLELDEFAGGIGGEELLHGCTLSTEFPNEVGCIGVDVLGIDMGYGITLAGIVEFG